MSFFGDFERSIDERLRRLFQSESQKGQVRELVEQHRMILDEIEGKVQMLPRAKRAFPCNEIAVRVAEPRAFETLEQQVREFFDRERIAYRPDLRVSIEQGEGPEPVVICRLAEAPAAAAPQAGTIRLTLPQGDVIESGKTRIQVGRQSEVLDEKRRLVRRNDVVVDGQTVSRAHAHIEFVNGEYRLFDDGSSYGTSAIHNGRLVEVPRAGGRGLRLHSGDEIYFGQVRVGFEIS